MQRQVRLRNRDGKVLITSVDTIAALRAWLAGSEPRVFVANTGQRYTVDPARIVAVDRFIVRVGSMRWHRCWTRA
jgi:hypothetical protein